eukprot:Blabericola_migrator_1__3141@NODE_1918_length_3563_cov_38_793192_g1226_i0_p2_GENE_NODE_1918_length_3563_cov_38_793192_g1226_i0NODE_1918_length_3563_cov_38_793192_g1226_i0_p2_ORF_typecomplete_len448_score51_25Bromodomain/PF00439_25/9_8e03Bromodomain/PF00439_25/0_35_NODE_1918_length_3563_cov_38_793192_g1226_i0391382
MPGESEIEASSGLPFALGPHHYFQCRRGELLLAPDEVKILNNYLAKQENGRRKWRFASENPAAPPIQPAGKPKAPPRTSEGSKRKSTVVKVDESAGQASSESKIKTEWGRSLHRLLLTLTQQEVAKPFVNGLVHRSQPLVCGPQVKRGADSSTPGHLTRHSTEAVRQKEIVTHIQPYLEPTCLRNIISKLEAGQYTTALEVFNEIYGFFLAGFRHYQPASPHWIRIHQLVTAFFASASSYPLKDDFVGPPSVIEEEAHPKHPPPGSKPARVTSAVKKRKRTGESKGKKRSTTLIDGEPPVRNRERRNFQKLLAALPVAAHLELYAKFKASAQWKEVKEGQVELDDANTPPAVFREMMIFCASRVTRKRPLPSAATSEVQGGGNEVHAPAEKRLRRFSQSEAGSQLQPKEGGPEYNWASTDSESASESSSSSSCETSSEGENGEVSGQ